MSRCWARIRIVVCSSLAAAFLSVVASVGAELPPEVQVDRLLVQAEREVEDGEHRSAAFTFARVLAICEEHGLAIPTEFWFRQAEVLHQAGRHQGAIEASTRYLSETGRQGKHYEAALRLLDAAELALEEKSRKRRLEEIEREVQESLRRWSVVDLVDDWGEKTGGRLASTSVPREDPLPWLRLALKTPSPSCGAWLSGPPIMVGSDYPIAVRLDAEIRLKAAISAQGSAVCLAGGDLLKVVRQAICEGRDSFKISFHSKTGPEAEARRFVEDVSLSGACSALAKLGLSDASECGAWKSRTGASNSCAQLPAVAYRALLGVKMRNVTPELSKSWGLGTPFGVYVQRVEPHSGAFRAGMRVGDVIVSVGGHEVVDFDGLNQRVGEASIGEAVRVGVVRDRDPRTVTVTTGAPLTELQGAVPLTAFRDAIRSGGQGPVMVVLPEGRFRMGCVSGRQCREEEKPIRPVTIPAPIAMSAFEVTFEDWDRCVAHGGCGGHRPKDEGWERSWLRAVINVSWADAQSYVSWLSAETGQQYRLPSEAEWEYAARAGTATSYSWGDDAGLDRAQCNGCRAERRPRTTPTGWFGANAFGLSDMQGNAAEWVEDCWNGRYVGAPADGSPWLEGDCRRRVLRGGHFDASPRMIRSASRARDSVRARRARYGFRVARTIAP